MDGEDGNLIQPLFSGVDTTKNRSFCFLETNLVFQPQAVFEIFATMQMTSKPKYLHRSVIRKNLFRKNCAR